MTEPLKPRKKLHPVVTVGFSALAGWVLLAVCMGEKTLDRADKAASVIGMLVTLGALALAIVEAGRRASTQDTDAPAEWPALLKRPSVVTALSTMAVGLVVVIIVGIATGGDSSEQGNSVADSPSASGAAVPAASETSAASPSTSGPAEPCAPRTQAVSDLPGAATSSVPVVGPSTDVVRHDGALILSEGYYADLDSLCPDWDVTDAVGSKQDIGNDGTGLTRSFSAGTQIAVVDKSAAATFAMCSSNTDYVSGVIKYADLRAGNRYCVLTDAGRRSLITVKRVRRDGSRAAVHVDVRTWAERRPSEETDYLPWVLLGLVVLVLAGGGAKKAASAKDED